MALQEYKDREGREYPWMREVILSEYERSIRGHPNTQ